MVFVLDSSVSMRGEADWLTDTAVVLDSALQLHGLGGNKSFCRNLYGLISYNSTDITEELLHSALLHTDMVQFVDTARGDGYAAVQYAIDNYRFRAHASKHILLLTDKDRNISSDLAYSYTSILSALQDSSIKLSVMVYQQFYAGEYFSGDNYVLGMASGGKGYGVSCNSTSNDTGSVYSRILVNTSYGDTYENYIILSWESGGIAWSISQLRYSVQCAVQLTSTLAEYYSTTIQYSYTVCHVCYCAHTSVLKCDVITHFVRDCNLQGEIEYLRVTAPSSTQLLVTWYHPNTTTTDDDAYDDDYQFYIIYYGHKFDLSIRNMTVPFNTKYSHFNKSDYTTTTTNNNNNNNNKNNNYDDTYNELISDLRPWEYYTVEVSPMYRNIRYGTVITATNKTLQDVPWSAPLSLNAHYSSSNNSIEMEWQPPNASSINGVPVHYAVHYAISTGEAFSTVIIPANSSNNSNTVYTYAIEIADRYATYNISVRLRNTVGYGPYVSALIVPDSGLHLYLDMRAFFTALFVIGTAIAILLIIITAAVCIDFFKDKNLSHVIT